MPFFGEMKAAVNWTWPAVCLCSTWAEDCFFFFAKPNGGLESLLVEEVYRDVAMVWRPTSLYGAALGLFFSCQDSLLPRHCDTVICHALIPILLLQPWKRFIPR